MDIEKLSLRRFMEKTNLKQRLKYLLGQTRVMNDVWVHFKRLHGVPPGGRGRRNHPPCVRKRATTLNKMKVCFVIYLFLCIYREKLHRSFNYIQDGFIKHSFLRMFDGTFLCMSLVKINKFSLTVAKYLQFVI